MIRQSFDIEQYWRVTVYYELDYGLFNIVHKELLDMGIPEEQIEDLYDIMSSGEVKAVTCSSIRSHISIVLFNRHDSKMDFINSIVHEAEHVKQAMLEAYQVEDKGEPPAYTIGYLISQMYPVFRNIICKKYLGCF